MQIETRVTDLLNETSKLVVELVKVTGKLPAHFIRGDAPSAMLETMDDDVRSLLGQILEQRGRFYQALNELLLSMASRWIDHLSVKGPGGAENESLLWMAVDKCLAEDRVWIDKDTFCAYSIRRFQFEVRNQMSKRSHRFHLLAKKADNSPKLDVPKFENEVSRVLGVIELLQSRMRRVVSQRYLLGRTVAKIAEHENMGATRTNRLITRSLSIMKVLTIVDELANEEKWKNAEVVLSLGLSDRKIVGKTQSQCGLVPLQVQRGLIYLKLGMKDKAQEDFKIAVESLDNDCHSSCGSLLDGLAITGDWATFELARQKIISVFQPTASLVECIEVLLAMARIPWPRSIGSVSGIEAIAPYVDTIMSHVTELGSIDIDGSDLVYLGKHLAAMLGCDEDAIGLSSISDSQRERETQSSDEVERPAAIAQLAFLRRPFSLHSHFHDALGDVESTGRLEQTHNEILHSPVWSSLSWLEKIYWEGQLEIARHTRGTVCVPLVNDSN